MKEYYLYAIFHHYSDDDFTILPYSCSKTVKIEFLKLALSEMDEMMYLDGLLQ